VAVAPGENEISFLKRDRVFFYWRRGEDEPLHSYSSSDNGKERIEYENIGIKRELQKKREHGNSSEAGIDGG
jgi:hypothetical protein